MQIKHCPKCHSEQFVKCGIIRGKQRYKCKQCGRQFSVGKLQNGYDERTKRQAVKMHLEGMGFRSIERVLHVSHNSVANWVKQMGKKS